MVEKIWSANLVTIVSNECYGLENSAIGGLKQARDSKTQALYALRGKIRNVEKVDIATVFQNQEVKDIIQLLGCGINEDYDERKLRYNKVIIATDEDCDGSHIRLLLLTFFYRFMPQLVSNGHVYCTVGPLFKVSHGDKHVYVKTVEEKDKYVKSIKGAYMISRYKGLGEMNPKDLSETMVNAKTRTLLQYTIDDESEVNETFIKLMGVDTAPRKQLLETGVF